MYVTLVFVLFVIVMSVFMHGCMYVTLVLHCLLCQYNVCLLYYCLFYSLFYTFCRDVDVTGTSKHSTTSSLTQLNTIPENPFTTCVDQSDSSSESGSDESDEDSVHDFDIRYSHIACLCIHYNHLIYQHFLLCFKYGPDIQV